MRFVTKVEIVIKWSRLWDMALDHGYKCTDGVRNLARVMIYPVHALKPCPLCNVEQLVKQSLLNHVLLKHSTLSGDLLMNSLLTVSNSDLLFSLLSAPCTDFSNSNTFYHHPSLSSVIGRFVLFCLYTMSSGLIIIVLLIIIIVYCNIVCCTLWVVLAKLAIS